MIKRETFFVFVFLFSVLSAQFSMIYADSSDDNEVIVVKIVDVIDQSTVEAVKEGMEKARVENAEAVILLIDTPGGGLQQTEEIAGLIHTSSIPVVGYVYPRGAKAWSAGAFILMATHVAAMSKQTVMGSCQPVDWSGVPINDSKIINALEKQIKTWAANRNQTVAGEFVTKNRNINETEALKFGVIEFVSPSLDKLLDDINGTKVETAVGNVTLHTANANLVFYSPSLKIYLLKVISNPSVTTILFMVGVLALIFGISSPGYGAEVFGVIAILLSLVGTGFDIYVYSIIFIVIGFLLLAIELFVVPGFGVIGIGGIICFAIGSISMEWVNGLMVIVLTTVTLLTVFFVFVLYKILRIRTKRNAVGVFEGETAETIDKITPDSTGYVMFKGEYWKATSDEIIEKNKKVIILKKEGSLLFVKPKK